MVIMKKRITGLFAAAALSAGAFLSAPALMSDRSYERPSIHMRSFGLVLGRLFPGRRMQRVQLQGEGQRHVAKCRLATPRN